ncbi:MAG: 2-oxoacid:ferredoxin oxidoreductase subunit gamma [Veillonellaceae bacterium]|nr:2-oxoacid:ferredoxin oxidoreductase subunit gamma [Veillonellaceae bacterium]
MNKEMIFAGFGGQGVMLMGQILAYAGMLEGQQVSWFPAYGPEMRGGTANCSVIIGDEPVGTPIVTDPSVVVAMNLPSLDKFESALPAGGTLLINSSLIDRKPHRTDIKTYFIPCNDIAQELGNLKVANMVMVGAIIAASGVVDIDSVISVLAKKIFKNKPKVMPINEQAIRRGLECINGK